MALTIAYEGTGVLAQAGGGTYGADGSGGTWSSPGGGSTAGYNPDAYVQGTESVGLKFPNKDGNVYYTHTSTLNFNSGGGQFGEFIYIWVNIQSNGQFDLITANPPGLSVIIGTNSNNYRRWAIAGDANDNSWGSGWKCFVIDPTTAGTSTQGTYNASTVNIIGLDINSDTSVRADSIFIDEITCAKGIRVTGTTTAGDAWGEILTWAQYTPATRRFGFVDNREGVIYCKGRVFIGNSTATTSFVDSGKIIKFETTEYYNGSAWVTAVPSTFAGITLEDGTGTTTFTDGVIVGSNNGRAGSTYIGNENESVDFDASGLTNSGSDINLYGTTFRQFSGGITFANNSNWVAYGCSFQNNAQVDPVGAVQFRNCTFAETSSTSAAFKWNANVDIQASSFIANTTGAAIEITQTTNQTFTALNFSGNTNDVLLNNGGTSIDVSNASGSNASTYTATGGGVVTFTVSAILTVSNLRAGSEVRIHRSSTGAEVGGTENATTADPINTGRYIYQYSYTTAEDVYIVVMNFNYQHQRINYTLGGIDETLLVSQVIDRNYSNP